MSVLPDTLLADSTGYVMPQGQTWLIIAVFLCVLALVVYILLTRVRGR